MAGFGNYSLGNIFDTFTSNAPSIGDFMTNTAGTATNNGWSSKLATGWDTLGGGTGVGTLLGGLSSVYGAYNTAKANSDNLKFMKKAYATDQARQDQAQQNLDTASLSLGDFNKRYGG